MGGKMRQAPDLLQVFTVALPEFARRHGPTLHDWLPNWRVVDREQAFNSGACLIFALALRRWSRARMSVLCIEINADNQHFLAVLAAVGELVFVDADGANLSNEYRVRLKLSGEYASVEKAISPIAGVRRHKQYKSWPLIEAYIDHLANAMDEEIGSGDALFAHFPVLPLDGFTLI
jgi:hypothetical protein